MKTQIDPMWASWFSGFVDGEGYFQLIPQSSGGYGIRLVITMRDDETNVIAEIMNTLRVGSVYHVSKEYDRRNGRQSADQWMWRCNRIDEVIGVIIPLFDSFPLKTRKANDYRIWREAALLIVSGGNRTQLPKLHALKQQLVKQRKYGHIGNAANYKDKKKLGATQLELL